MSNTTNGGGGGMTFPWKMQKILQHIGGGVTTTPRSRESLPEAPKGMEWIQNDTTKEWKLEKTKTDSNNKEPALVTEEQRCKQQQICVPVTPPRTTATSPDLPPRCTTASNSVVVDRIPRRSSSFSNNNNNKEDDWELLSDRQNGSTSSNQTPAVIVHRMHGSSGSVRSLTSMEDPNNTNNNEGGNNNNNMLSLPFKIQRTASSSTIDSSDNALGPSGKGVLGVDYVEHVILPSDTLQGICLTYKISTTRLRQANHFSGNSLLLAPKKLVIPLSKKALRSGFIRVQDTDKKEYKLHAILAEFPDLSMTEAKAYLELSDWVLQDAIRSAKDDGEWEREMDHCSLRSGEIRITPRLTNKGIPIGFDTKGAGIQPTSSATNKTDPKATNNKKQQYYTKQQPQVTSYKAVPAIATKTIQAQDVYMAVPQHNNFGVELQSLSPSSSSLSATTTEKKQHPTSGTTPIN